MDEEEAALILIESPDTTTSELVGAFRDLYVTIYWMGESSDPLRCLNACLMQLARHADPVEYRDIWLNLVQCLEYAADWDEARSIAPLLAHDCNPLGLLLSALTRCDKSDKELSWRLSAAIKGILTMGSQKETNSIVDRYYEQIKRAFLHMSSRALCDLVGWDDFAVMMLLESSVLEFIVNELRGTKNPWDLAQMSNVAVSLMATAIEVNDSERLEHMLGLGAMKSASILVASRGMYWTGNARMFTDILNRHPEWKEYFKQSTKNGDPDNEITAVGRRIIDRPKVPPTMYVLEKTMEEQDEPSQTTVPSSQPAAIPKQEPAASKEEEPEEGGGVATFADLPEHFLVGLTRSMTFAEMAKFRLTCKKTLAAVDQRGRSMRALDIVRLSRELWPGKHGLAIDSLHCLQYEISRLAHWTRLELINFTGVGTMNVAQLHTIFGIEPRPNVQQLDLVGVVVMPSVWSSLAHLFPGVIAVHCTEHSCKFPASIKQEAMLVDGEKIGGRNLTDRKELVKNGLLGEDRLITLRCLTILFPAARYMHIG